MMISNLCLTLTDGLSLVACILSVISLIFITKINGILKKQSTNDSNQVQKNDFEKIKLLFDNLVQTNSYTNDLIVNTIKSNDEQLLNYLQKNNQSQMQSTQNVELRIRNLLDQT